jgi:hypothetical protein
MKKVKMILVLVFLLAASLALSPQIARADLEWRIVKDLDLKATPLDVAPSADGQWLFILTPGEILVYSVPEEKVVSQIPVEKEFDRIASLPRGNSLTVTSSTKKTLQVILLETIYKIDLTGLPFRGPQNAPVTVAVFTDYQ